MSGYVKIELNKRVLSELKLSLPGFSFKGQKQFKVLVTCQRCWEINEGTLANKIRARDKFSFRDIEYLKKERGVRRDQYNRVVKNIMSLRPGTQQRNALRDARLAYEEFKNKVSAADPKDFSSCVVRPSYRHYLLQSVDWAIAHICNRESKEELVAMSQILFELGLTPGDQALGRSRKLESAEENSDEEDLLDIVPD